MSYTKKQNLPIYSNLPDFWKDILSSSQIFANEYSYLPEVKTCRLRVTYLKLQSQKFPKKQTKLQNFNRKKGSFLLDKQSRNLSSFTQNYKSQQIHRQNLIDENNTRYNKTKYITIQAPKLIRTIDVDEIKRMSGSKRNLSHSLSKSRSIRRSGQFADYFKKIVQLQKANNDSNKLVSEGKGLDFSDRSHFEKLQKIKWSALNQKILQKQKKIQCVSTRLNNQQKSSELPNLKLNQQSKKKFSKKRSIQTKKQQQTSLCCQPWESQSIFHDFQQ